MAGVKPAAARVRVDALLDLVGLRDKADAYPAKLSGGQKQRVGIARALVHEPRILLCDEATSALDPETTQSILALLRDINRKLGLTVVLITHDMAVIREICHQVLVLDGGRKVEQGEVWRVFGDPGAEATRALLRPLQHDLPADLAARLSPEPQGPGASGVLRLRYTGAGRAQGRPLAALAALGPGATLLHGAGPAAATRRAACWCRCPRTYCGRKPRAPRWRRIRSRCWAMSLPMLDKYLQAFLQTLAMVGVSAVIAIALGLSLALVLTVTAPGGLYPKPRLNRALSITVNTLRAIPFIILLIAMLPFTRLLVGTTLGTWAAIVPLSANLVPFFARIAQVSLNDVDPGLVEAARAMAAAAAHRAPRTAARGLARHHRRHDGQRDRDDQRLGHGGRGRRGRAGRPGDPLRLRALRDARDVRGDRDPDRAGVDRAVHRRMVVAPRRPQR